VVGYAGRPGAAMRHLVAPEFAVYSDSRGCRVDGPDQAGPARVDLVALGCSFTFGFGVDNEETFVHRVADELELSTCNAAVPAYGTTAAVLTADRYADLAPKVLLYGFIGTHEKRNLLPCATTDEPYCRPVAFVDTRSGSPQLVPPGRLAPGADAYLGYQLTSTDFGPADVLWAAARDLYRVLGLSPAAVNEPFEAQAADPAARAQAVDFLLGELAKRAEEQEARLVVAYLPIPGDVQPMPESLRAALARRPEIPVADLTADFQAYEASHAPQSLRLSATDAHPNAAVHALIARGLAPVLAEALEARQGR
jgi:hypothetical protein